MEALTARGEEVEEASQREGAHALSEQLVHLEPNLLRHLERERVCVREADRERVTLGMKDNGV